MANGHSEIDAEKLNKLGCEYGRMTNNRIDAIEKEVNAMYFWIKTGIVGIIGMFFTIITMLAKMLWG